MGRSCDYDPALRKTEHGAKLYQAWKKLRMGLCCEEWGSFFVFYTWAMENGYESGAWLIKINQNEPFSPDNCEWRMPVMADPSEWIANWNKSVNRIRKHYGMPPLEGTDYGD